jgi:hypothetical protein
VPSYEQYTIETLVKTLGVLGETPVGVLTNPHSHRGDYSELAFELGKGMVPAAQLVDLVRSCLGREFEGWKGGTSTYHGWTAVCVAERGHAGGLLCGPDSAGEWVVAYPA